MLKDFSLEGRKALCVGAGRGIGKGVALVMAEAGADVAVASMNPANAQAVADQVAAQGRASASFQVDATNEESMRNLARDVAAKFGDIDVLVNCVGDSIRKPLVELPDGPPGAMTFEDWKHVIDLNLTHAVLGCQAFGPGFLERRSGNVINISSYHKARGRLASAAYNSGKQALNQLTRDLAIEWAPYGIRVNAIGPGVYPDPDQRSPEHLKTSIAELVERVPLGREGRMRDVGLMAVYLASEASSYVTGQLFVIDGGLGIA